MTVTYNAQIHTVSFAGFFKLLIRWNGSIYKLLWRDFTVYAFFYITIALVYHFALSKPNKIGFEGLFDYFNKYQDSVPVSFVLGFYVSAVVSRWWEQYNAIPYPSRLAIFVTAHIRGQDERSRLIRRTILRYACTGIVMTMKTFCVPVKQRFPTLKHLTEAGMLLPNEQKKLEDLNTPYNKYYVPFIWASTLVAKSKKDGLLKDDFGYHCVVDEINAIRFKCQTLMHMDWINIPLVYTQVATLAVYIYFFSCLFSRQYIPYYTNTKTLTNQGEVLVPVFTFLQFMFYMGWLKVAEELLNPFSDDDDDFDVSTMIDKNLKVNGYFSELDGVTAHYRTCSIFYVAAYHPICKSNLDLLADVPRIPDPEKTSYLIVDDMHQEIPELLKDQYWDTQEIIIPYTEASLQHYKAAPQLGSVEAMIIPEEKQFIINLTPVPEDGDKPSGHGLLNRLSRRSMKNDQEKGNEKDDEEDETIVPDTKNQKLKAQRPSELVRSNKITFATNEATSSSDTLNKPGSTAVGKSPRTISKEVQDRWSKGRGSKR